MRVLLHICCGVCAIPAAEKLLCDGYTITGFFYNPNIHPADEYHRRLEAVEAVAREFQFELVEGKYDRENWFEAVKGFEYSPERGERCGICYRKRLEKAYEYARRHTYPLFTTTLTASPLKDAELINEIGREIAGDKFIMTDLKKNGGHLEACARADEMGIYKQNYCGCVYGHEQQIARRSKKDETSD